MIQNVSNQAVNINNSIKPFLVPESVLILYALVTCLLVGVHMLALMISTCILPQVEATALDSFELEQQFHDHKNTILNQSTQMINAAISAVAKPAPQSSSSNNNNNNNNNASTSQLPQTPNSTGGGVPTIHINGGSTTDISQHTHDKSNQFLFQDALTATEILFPYNKFHRFIELAWISSTVIGIFLFLVEIGLVCYIKFYPISVYAAMTGAIVMTPILILFVVFTITFYRRLADLKLGLTKLYLHQVDRNLRPYKESV